MSLSKRKVFAQEYHSSEIKSFTRDEDGSIQVISSKLETGLWVKSARSVFESIFLPAGFPDSVSSDYISYQIWDSLQAFCSSLNNTLATHAVLKGAGVGDANATPLAATITWLMRDGTGMMGSILFAFHRGTTLDSECKKWRLFADVANDVSALVDLTSHHFPSFFLLVQCFAGLMRSMVGVAGSATRAALTQHQARRNNLADVSAKDSSQETLVNLMALIVNLLIVPMVVKSSTVVWTMFFILTFLHLFCNYKAIRSVNMEVFNMSRFKSTVKKFLHCGTVLSRTEANFIENVWFFIHEESNVFLGVPFDQHENLSKLEEKFKEQQYAISLENGKCSVSLRRSASSKDILKACFHAIMAIEKNSVMIDQKNVEEKFDRFFTECVKVGWSFEKHLLHCDEYRYDWC